MPDVEDTKGILCQIFCKPIEKYFRQETKGYKKPVFLWFHVPEQQSDASFGFGTSAFRRQHFGTVQVTHIKIGIFFGRAAHLRRCSTVLMGMLPRLSIRDPLRGPVGRSDFPVETSADFGHHPREAGVPLVEIGAKRCRRFVHSYAHGTWNARFLEVADATTTDLNGETERITLLR